MNDPQLDHVTIKKRPQAKAIRLTEYEREQLARFACKTCNEFAFLVSHGPEAVEDYQQLVLLNEEAARLLGLFNESPCIVLPSQIRRAITLAGSVRLCAWGQNEEEWNKAVVFYREFKKHMNTRLREASVHTVSNQNPQLECPKCGTVQPALNEKCYKCGAQLIFGKYANLTRWIVGGIGALFLIYVFVTILAGVMSR